MKLAEALANRADLQRRIEQMRGRLQKSALVQEDPQELLEETERLVSELEGYVRRINRTNLSATLADGETTLTEALARRDALTLRYGTLNTFVSTASDRLPRYGRAEIRILPAVEVGPLRRRMDELARQRRELDTAIQQANWAIDLMEG
jgi:chromosome segregation ATPase